MNNFSPIKSLQSAFPLWQTPPTIYPANIVPYPGVNQFFLEGPAYHGRPTRIFGFWQLPEGADAEHPVPGIVLIHGGGGTALPDWVQLWNRRGFAAIAVDNCGKVPAWSLCTRYNSAWPQHEFSGPDAIFTRSISAAQYNNSGMNSVSISSPGCILTGYQLYKMHSLMIVLENRSIFKL